MRRLFAKGLFLILLCLFVGVAIFNYHFVKVNFFGFKSLDIPLFLVIFGAFILGSIVNLGYFMLKKK